MRFAILWVFWIVLAMGDSAGSSRTVVDGVGRRVDIPVSPKRIVSLAPSVTEILFALGAGDRVIGVTDFCDYPPEACSRTHIGGLITPDLERIVGLRPDLVFASTAGNYRDVVEQITRLGIPTYTIDTPTVEAMLDMLGAVGSVVGTPETAGELVTSLRGRIQRIRASNAQTPRPRILFVIEPDPLIAPGKDTFIGQALHIAGAQLATTDSKSGWSQYDMEQIIGMKPDVILTPESNREWSTRILSAERWHQVPAVVSGRVFVISDAIQHPGPRLVDGMEEVARILRAIDRID